MGGQGMEKRVAGIVRWLERFQRSYRSGAMESALMDAECARADLETLRQDIWGVLGSSRMSRRRRGMFLYRVVLVAFLVVLAMSVPLSEPWRNLAPEDETVHSPHDSLFAWTALNVLDSGSAPDEGWVGGAVLSSVRRDDPSPRGVVSARKPVPARPVAAGDKQGGGRGPRGVKEEKKVPYETVFSLLQTGARALKNEEPVIVVDRGQGKGESGL